MIETDSEVPLPAVEEVREGVWALPLPMSGPLGHVFAYAVELDEGTLLIDAGPDTDAAFEALQDGLRLAGSDLADVRAILFTHGHPDHYGSSRRLREVSGAWLGLHRADAELLSRVTSEGRAEGLERLRPWLTDLGVESPELDQILEMVNGFEYQPPSTAPDRYIVDGERFAVAGGELVAVHTPGHAPGHMCFVHDEAELVFTGDHILDPTTPNVSINRFTYGNPLADYIVALARMREFGDVLGLPGHQDRVTVARRADAIIAHHEAQLDSVTAILAAGPGTVREVAEQMRWSFDWDEFGPGSIFMATGEALAHLAVLELRGAAEKVPGKPTRWRASAG